MPKIAIALLGLLWMSGCGEGEAQVDDLSVLSDMSMVKDCDAAGYANCNADCEHGSVVVCDAGTSCVRVCNLPPDFAIRD